MAKNRHEKLAALVTVMFAAIDDHLLQCERVMRATKGIVFLERWVQAPVGVKKWCIVTMSTASGLTFDYEYERLKMILFCPNPCELSDELNWYECEDETNSFSYQFRSIQELLRREAIIQANYLKDPIPIYEEAIKAWLADLDADICAKTPRKLKEIGFAPKMGQSAAQAYEVLRKSARARESRHRQTLRKYYRQKLEEAIFEGIPLEDPLREEYLREWENNMFGRKEGLPSSKKDGRWTQCQSVDRRTAGRCVLTIVNAFLENPAERHLGEIACILWLCIQASQEGFSITLTEVLALTTQQISSESLEISFSENRKLEVSIGLCELLRCLRGEGEGQRARRLFGSVNIKQLERTLSEVSIQMGVSPPILPGAFLIPFHICDGKRIGAAQRYSMRKAQPLIPLSAEKTRKTIKTWLKDSLKKPIL